MPERLTHQALPALACFVGLLGPSCGPLWGAPIQGAPLICQLPSGSSRLCSGRGLCLRTAQAQRRWLELLGAVPLRWEVALGTFQLNSTRRVSGWHLPLDSLMKGENKGLWMGKGQVIAFGDKLGSGVDIGVEANSES